ncbi:MAG: XrtA system polysaccharide deacetylase [Candidatus Desantisbacteria bacterium]
MLNALSFDVEDWYHSVASIPFEEWDRYEDRLVLNMNKILRILDEYGIKATFFILGCVADKYPEMVKSLHKEGHEIASHGYNHRLLYQLSPDEFREDLKMSVGVIEELISDKVIGYRAPYWSINKQTNWALDIIRQEGLRYDSSIYPVKTHLYGMPSSPRYPYIIGSTESNPLIEFPPSTIRVCGINLPMGSGFYFRAFPYQLTRWGLSRINKEGKPVLICLHPPEFDSGKPKPKNLTFGESILHYHNLSTTLGKFSRLVKEFRFGTIREVLFGKGGLSC